jgi:hypothetical protein
MKKPNFFIVGAPKCGTTWLHHYLSVHPQVFMPESKEPHYFNTDSNFRSFWRLEDYEGLFRDASSEHKRVGEASVWYLFSSVAVANILKYQPDAKFIVMVRNPLTMAPSLHQQALYSLREDESEFSKAWALQEDRANGGHIPPHSRDPSMLQYRSVCSLGEQVTRLIGTAGRERVLVVVHDDLCMSPKDVFCGVVEFLELQPWSPDHFEIVNAARRIKHRRLKRAEMVLTAFKSRIGMRASSGILRGLWSWNRKSVAVRRPPAKLMHEMASAFADDIQLLSDQIGRPLGDWLLLDNKQRNQVCDNDSKHK